MTKYSFALLATAALLIGGGPLCFAVDPTPTFDANIVGGTVTVNGAVSVSQGTTPWVTSRNWTLSNGTDSIAAVQSGTWTVQQGSAPWSVSQSGVWTTGRTWTLSSGTDSTTSVQGAGAGAGSAWSVKITDGSGFIGSFPNISGGSQGTVNVPGTVLDTFSLSAGYDGSTHREMLVDTSGRMYTLLNDVSGNGITSQASGSKRALDVGIDVSGVQVDPRARTWTLGAGTDAVTVTQGPAASASGAWPTEITDGTNTAAVKAASTAAATSDPAAVVALSPNTPTPLTNDRQVTGTITTACASGVSCAAGSTVQISVIGTATLGFETHGTWSATLTTDISYDSTCSSSPGSANWYQTGSIDTDQNETVYLVSWGSANNNDPWIMPVAGAQCARIRATAFVSGTVNVTLDAAGQTAAAWTIPTGNTPSGSADFGSPIKIGGKYNSPPISLSNGNRGDIQLGPQGQTVVTLTDGYKATYSASVTDLVTAATPTDIFTITGSNTKTIRINRVDFSGTTSTAAIRDIVFLKRSTANSGGTSSSVTAVPNDSSSAAASATVLSYTANPSLGSLVGNIKSFKYAFSQTTLNSANNMFYYDFGNRPGQSIVLRGTGEVFAVNLNGVTTSGPSVNVSIEWTEE